MSRWMKISFVAVVLAISVFLNVLVHDAMAGSMYEENNVSYSEQALYIQLKNGQDWTCLMRSTSYGETAEGWLPMTCNEMNTELIWINCWVKRDEPSFMCGHPGHFYE